MKATKQIAGLSIVALTLIGGAAAAQTVSGDQGVAAGKTREQVRAELVAAQNAGEMLVGFVAVAKRDLNPDRYGAPTAAPQYARAHSDRSQVAQ